MSRGKKIALVTGVFVVIIAGLSLTTFLKKNPKVITVKTSVAQKGGIKSYLNTTGIIKSKNIKDYYGSQLKVSKVKVKVGDSVKKGDVLVTFDNSDLQSAVQQAQLQYDNAVLSRDDLLNQKNNIQDTIASLDNQIKDLQNKIKTTQNTVQNETILTKYETDLEKAKVKIASLDSQIKDLQNIIKITQNTLQNENILTKYQTELEKAKAKRENLQPISNDKVKQSDNAVSLAKLSLDNAKLKASSGGSIVADFDGVITAVNVSEGGVANPSIPVVELKDLGSLKVVVSLSKSDVERVKLDQSAVVKAGGKSYNGKVSFLSPAGKKSGLPAAAAGASSDVTLDADIDLLEIGDTLKVEFDADIDILLGEKNGVVNVPTEALKSAKGGKTLVYIVDSNGKVTEKEVKVGLQSDLNAEILSGVNEGEKVILNPNTSIENGIIVKESGEGEK
ncbi:hypothetical protein CPJCM30710_01330 [Clostridium polyendosporum]|uniref:YknX-like C-terminal permuted SH3-like domain-containing protein n=1 Tax=Clostridium polyendosporum TaxID=69208 RepID=A0A919VEU4_9CLOT|nr:HlyD family efflux transporter periplasmic adaptor subunit [Clostridium polyendosporum]GIM27467.1 hypothetical protein CPJCM30710_01330 [Clostridium polyendosporum]